MDVGFVMMSSFEKNGLAQLRANPKEF